MGRDRMLTSAEAAEMLGLKPQTLAQWRSQQREGPPYVKLGAAVRYRLSDLTRWIERRTLQSEGRE